MVAENESMFSVYQCHTRPRFNSLPNDKILALTKFKVFADDKIIVTQKWNFVLGRVENIVGKGETAGYQHFLLFPQCFLKLSFSEVFKVGIEWYWVNFSSEMTLINVTSAYNRNCILNKCTHDCLPLSA